MELHQLRYFVAVAETENFTRASERSNISQPSLSQQIINLEKELDQKLFHRLGKKAVLTEAGVVFLERAKRILFEVEDATKELSDKSGLERRITVGAVQTVMPYLLTGLIARCRETHPNLLIDAHENFRSDLVEAVLDGVLDLAVVPQPVKEHRVAVEHLFREPLLLAVGKAHPFASRSEINVQDLANETFVSLGDSSTLAAQIRSFFGDQHLQPRIGIRCAQVATLKLFVAAGLGITLLPQLARLPDDRDSLVYLRLTGSAPTREIVVIRHLQRYQSRGAEQFLELLREHVRKHVASGSEVRS
jgi:LysR family hydrogen peroxide-inducible transcriptional activator